MTNLNWDTVVSYNGVPMTGDQLGDVWYIVPTNPSLRWCGRPGHQFTARKVKGGWDVAHHSEPTVEEFQRMFTSGIHHEPLRYFFVPSGVRSITPFIGESLRLAGSWL